MDANQKKGDNCSSQGCRQIITVYKSNTCLPCRRLVPSIVEQAERAGFIVRVIDVYSLKPEDRLRSRHVKWVPHIEYQGRELTASQLEALIDRKVDPKEAES